VLESADWLQSDRLSVEVVPGGTQCSTVGVTFETSVTVAVMFASPAATHVAVVEVPLAGETVATEVFDDAHAAE
jgi:hypothetical protein